MTDPRPAGSDDAFRTVEIPAARLERWLATFAGRHGSPLPTSTPDGLRLAAPDGAVAVLHVPFPPAAGAPRPPTDDPVSALAADLAIPRVVGALLVRRGGVGIGVFEGSQLVTSKIETAYVQGRTKAGGWSQQRYARRRANQAQALTGEAVEVAVRLLLPRAADLVLLVRGGDRALIDDVLADRRLEPLRGLPTTSVLAVPDPRQAVLDALPERFLAVRIDLNELA